MQFTLSELQNEIKENSNKLLKENIDLLETIQKVDENCRIDKKVWDLVIEQGWLALDIPEEDGGLGLDGRLEGGDEEDNLAGEVFVFFLIFDFNVFCVKL